MRILLTDEELVASLKDYQGSSIAQAFAKAQARQVLDELKRIDNRWWEHGEPLLTVKEYQNLIARMEEELK